MNANEETKIKFVYPDKLYARCKDNKTIDMSYAPQNLEAVEYIRTDAFVEKSLKFLDENFYFNNLHYSVESGVFDSKEEMFEECKKYIEE